MGDDSEMDWTSQFKEFVSRKEREAVDAPIHPFRTVTDEHPPGFEPIGDAWSRQLFDGPFFLAPAPSATPAASLVFVQSRDGNTGARNPEALGGGAADKHLIYEGLSRVAAHAVLTGAETIRGGNVVFSVWRQELVDLRRSLGLPRHPTQIVATLRGLPIDRMLIFNVPDVPAVILTLRAGVDAMSARIAERPWVRAIEMTAPADLERAFQQLHDMDVARISCIGGRTIARSLIDAGLVQDLYLTTSARPGGEPDTPLTEHPLNGRTIVRKHGTGPDEGVIFEHIAF